MKVLFGQRRVMVLATLAILVLVVAALVASSASFTASSTNGSNVFTAGNLNLTAKNSADADGGVILTATNRKPAYDQTGYVKVETTGVGGLVHLAASQSSGTTPNLAAKLRITIQEVADMSGAALTSPPAPLMNGLLMNAMPASTSLDPWAAGTTTHYYAIHVQWLPGANDDGYQDADTTATFVWDVVSQ